MAEQGLTGPVGVFSRGILRIPYLAALLGAPLSARSWGRFPQAPACIAGWGRRPSSLPARRYAAEQSLPYLALEDGFLRSVGLGRDDPPLSLVWDDQGIYYDAGAPSRLESLIPRPLSDAETARAAALLAAWRDGRVSKYNHLPEYAGELPQRYVLLADQTFGDAAIAYGLADADSFPRMLQAALRENPQCTVLVKIHPDVFAGHKRGHFDLVALAGNPRIQVLAEDVHPVGLIEQAEAVYVVTSQMGFEALLWGKPVRVFGLPFYAGWGLTADELPAPPRRQALGPAGLLQLLYAALVEYPRYRDPETGQPCPVETVLAHLALQRRMRGRFPPLVYALGFSWYKRPILRAFLQGSTVRFVRRAEQAPAGGLLAVWGRRAVASPGRVGTAHPTHLMASSAHRSPLTDYDAPLRLLRLEDGFLRSVGLGADLIRPLSWVLDRQGIYYDAGAPSDLEQLAAGQEFSAELLARAAALRARIVAEGLTKYNVGAGGWARPAGAGWVILVPGQVESDAAIRYGTTAIRGNLGLLQAVRQANPAAYVLYKPHPDVQSGLRAAGQNEDEAGGCCDELVRDVSMQVLLEQVDEVHVLTSLAGFEALLRGKRVATYGQPFYAGWGLTEDFGLSEAVRQRRARRLALDELVAAVLILYPTYVSRRSGRFTTPERALDELLAWRQEVAAAGPWQRLGRRLLRGLLRGWRRWADRRQR